MSAIWRRGMHLVIFAAALSSPLCAETASIPIGTLIGEGKNYDGKTVVIEGEAIGDIMRRGDSVWVNVLSRDGAAIGVLMNAAQIKNIRLMGDYSHQGDNLLIKGTMHRFAPMLQGETCVVAREVRALKTGYEMVHPISRGKEVLGGILTACSIMAILFYKLRYVRKERMMNGNAAKRHHHEEVL